MATSGLTKHERTSEIAMFARLLKADNGNLSRSSARYILTLGFDDDDQEKNARAGREEPGWRIERRRP